jgi:hypothetical protein
MTSVYIRLQPVEVKASQQQEVATLTKKDAAANYLVWMNFGRLLQGISDGSLEIITLPQPAHVLGSPTHSDFITLVALKKAGGTHIHTTSITLSDLLLFLE